MSKSSKKEYIDYRLNQAKETLAAAKSLARDEHWNSVINRLYYSCFYAISALLYKHDINPKSHFLLWQAGDYGDFVDFDKEKTLPLIPRTDNLLITIEDLIKEK